MIDTVDYTVDVATDNALDDIPAGGRVGTAVTLTGKTVTNGVADADDVTFTAVTGDTVRAIVLYKSGGSEAASPLIAYIDTSSGPVTPNGSNIVVTWDSGSNKILKL